MILPSPRSTLFPYTTLFRSHRGLQEASEKVRYQPHYEYENAHFRMAKRNFDKVVSVVQPLVLRRLPSISRSEEHTSELQSLTNLVCRLLLEKKKQELYKSMQ